MRATTAIAAIVAVLTACSGGDDSRTEVSTVRDSAGVSIVEISAQGWASAPSWRLASAPIAVIGGEGDDGSVDLSNSQLGTLLPDGRVVAMSMQPVQLYLFAPDGSLAGRLGRGGEGPGEYRLLTSLLVLGSDTIAGFDFMNRRALMFRSNGDVLDPVQFPMTASPVPPLLTGRLEDGSWVFQTMNPLQEPPEGTTGVYRLPAPVLHWRAGMETYDTVAMSLGPMLIQGTISMGSNSMTMGRGIGYGSNSFVGGARDLIWVTTGDRFVISGYDVDGNLKREIRVGLPTRTVTQADRDRFIGVLREQLELARGMAPDQLIDSEIAKLSETTFADNHAAIGQMLVDRMGRIWATPNLPMVDSTATWGVFDQEGRLIGSVVIPAGTLYAASEDRVVVRIEDDETGLVRLEVLGLVRDESE
jgi:hypothetical protein